METVFKSLTIRGRLVGTDGPGMKVFRIVSLSSLVSLAQSSPVGYPDAAL